MYARELLLDVDRLCGEVKTRNICKAIIYGIGKNGKIVYDILVRLGVKIIYCVDGKAEKEELMFSGITVISPKELVEKYDNEYIIITPNRHEDIVSFLRTENIDNERIILPFLINDEFYVDQRLGLSDVSIDINFCKKRPDNPKITVTTIAYNTREYIFRRTIESVLRQTERAFIYVIIINGATDNCLTIANEYAQIDSRIEVISLDRNYKWTDLELINAISNHIYGNYWCELDSDDFFSDSFILEMVKKAEEGKGDVVCARSMRVVEPVEMENSSSVYSFTKRIRKNCSIGKAEIMIDYFSGDLLGVWWGKIYSRSVADRYFSYLACLDDETRNAFFRLDVAMTYKMLTFAERVFYLDKVKHFVSVAEDRSTNGEAPIEWVMSIWYVYKNIKEEVFLWMEAQEAKELCIRYLTYNFKFLSERKEILQNLEKAAYKERVKSELKKMNEDDIVCELREKCCEKNMVVFFERLNRVATE